MTDQGVRIGQGRSHERRSLRGSDRSVQRSRDENPALPRVRVWRRRESKLTVSEWASARRDTPFGEMPFRIGRLRFSALSTPVSAGRRGSAQVLETSWRRVEALEGDAVTEEGAHNPQIDAV